jgi:general secretion pathway protein G
MGRPTTPGDGPPPGRGDAAGFTLIELITVVAIISILAAIALPQYKVAIIQSKEAVLKENLFRLRDLIDQYYVDKGKYPASLEALVEEGYLRRLPDDPITRATDWVTVPAEQDADRPGEEPGIYDVKSASTEASLSGTPYGEW